MAKPDDTPPPDRLIVIYVNGEEAHAPKGLITYERVVEIAFPGQTGGEYVVTYTRGPSDNVQGSLSPTDSVRIKKGMSFSAWATTRS